MTFCILHNHCAAQRVDHVVAIWVSDHPFLNAAYRNCRNIQLVYRTLLQTNTSKTNDRDKLKAACLCLHFIFHFRSALLVCFYGNNNERKIVRA